MGGVADVASSAPRVSSWFPMPPADPGHAAIRSLQDPEPSGLLWNSKANIDGPSRWNPGLTYDLVRKSAAPYLLLKPSRYSDVRVLPPPPSYIPAESEAYVENLGHGNSGAEAEAQMFGSSGPCPDPVLKAGGLSEYESILEFGNDDRETEEEGFVPHYSFSPQGFWEFPVVFASAGPIRSSSQRLEANTKYPPCAGPVPPGTPSHFHSNYEAGGNYWDEVGYERFYYPKV